MTRQLSRKVRILGVSVLLIAVLTLLTVPAAPARQKSKKHAFAEHSAASVPERAIVPPQALLLQSSESSDTRRTSTPREQKMASSVDTTDGGPFIFMLFPTILYDPGELPASAAVGDVNRDGQADLVVVGNANVHAGGGLVSVLLGNGDGTFQPPVIYSSGGYGAWSGLLADVNGDGKLDVVLTNCNTTNDFCWEGSSVAVLLGNGDGTFQSPILTRTGLVGYNPSAAIADVNRDGKPDVLVASMFCFPPWQYSGAVVVLLGNGDGTFKAGVPYSSASSAANAVAVADINSDGKTDLIVANCNTDGTNEFCQGEGSVGVLLGNGDGTFQPVLNYDSGGVYPLAISVGDVNSDLKPDVLVSDAWSNAVGVLLGNGDGTFQAPVTYNSGNGAGSLEIMDLNGDGKLDLAVGSVGVGVLLGNGNGTFGPVVTYNTGYGGESATIADVNGDGRPDLAVIVPPYDVGVLLNNSGAASTTTSVVASTNPVPLNQSVTYTALVTPTSGGTASGMIEFQEGGYVIGSVLPLVNNQATLSRSYTYIGSHSISASYSGELNKAAGSMSSILTEYVSGPTTTKLTTSGSPSLIGQPVTFTANVTSHYGAIPNGELVNFYDGTSFLKSVALTAGSASYTTSTLSDTAHIMKATYTGDNTFAPSSGQVGQVVNGYATTTTFVSSLNPSIYGQKVTWTATVTTTGSVPPTGTVAFIWSDGFRTFNIGSATLNSSGVAVLTRSNLNADPYPLTAKYQGDANNLTSTSPILNQTVLQATSAATITSSPNPSVLGQAVTFTATITSPTVTPTGPVTFTTGKTVLGTAQLSRGKATLTTSALPAGSSVVTATFNGDSNIAKSSASVTQVVQ